MKKNVIRLNEGQLKRIIRESVLGVIKKSKVNEVSSDMIRRAYDRVGDTEIKAVDEIMDILDDLERSYHGTSDEAPVRKCKEYLKYIDNFLKRKQTQRYNFQDTLEDRSNAADAEIDSIVKQLFPEDYKKLKWHEYRPVNIWNMDDDNKIRAVLRRCSPATKEEVSNEFNSPEEMERYINGENV